MPDGIAYICSCNHGWEHGLNFKNKISVEVPKGFCNWSTHADTHVYVVILPTHYENKLRVLHKIKNIELLLIFIASHIVTYFYVQQRCVLLAYVVYTPTSKRELTLHAV